MKAHIFGALVGAGVLVASVHGATITNVNVGTQSDVTGGLVGLDISGVVSGLTTNNSLTKTFNTGFGSSGSVTATVFGNVGTPGGSLNTVVIVYEFVGNGPSGIDQFTFGGSGAGALDLGDIESATHGSIDDATTAGQVIPSVTTVDNSMSASPDTFNFNFLTNNDMLGTPSGSETLTWYVMTTGDIQIGLTQLQVVNGGAATFDMLALVNIPGQSDLSMIPLPSAAGLGLAGLAMIGVRRRR